MNPTSSWRARWFDSSQWLVFRFLFLPVCCCSDASDSIWQKKNDDTELLCVFSSVIPSQLQNIFSNCSWNWSQLECSSLDGPTVAGIQRSSLGRNTFSCWFVIIFQRGGRYHPKPLSRRTAQRTWERFLDGSALYVWKIKTRRPSFKTSWWQISGSQLQFGRPN